MVREVFVVDEHTEKTALEVDMVKINRLSPETAKGENLESTELWWVRLSKGLAFVHKEDAKVVSLSENH